MVISSLEEVIRLLGTWDITTIRASMGTYMLYVTTLIATIRRIVEFAEQFQRGMTGIERFAEIMDTPVTIKDADLSVSAERQMRSNKSRTPMRHRTRESLSPISPVPEQLKK